MPQGVEAGKENAEIFDELWGVFTQDEYGDNSYRIDEQGIVTIRTPENKVIRYRMVRLID